MPLRQSAGLVMYRGPIDALEVFLAHPGGPQFAQRDEGVWSIPKGEFEPGETPIETAIREFQEETGIPLPPRDYFSLGEITQKGGKVVHAWGFSGEGIATDNIQSNEIRIEWPRNSNHWITIPEVDRAAYFSLAEARRKLKERQVPFLDRLRRHLAS